MDNEPITDKPKLCRIEIMFQAKDDETALKVKQAVNAAVKDLPNKRVKFLIDDG